jgi:hypothetical protein
VFSAIRLAPRQTSFSIPATLRGPHFGPPLCRSRPGAIYSFAAATALSSKPPGEWKTMIVTLAGNRILVEMDGQRVTSFDPDSPAVPRDRKWFEGKRGPRRPEVGYLGLQNHDPGDVVWFREISVRPLPTERDK